ncbi:MAG: hypothetical protein HZA58_02765 [Acidimicrobiia bacterium]|nr:hypothetical protein [Acidimicrobiia bacterium]
MDSDDRFDREDSPETEDFPIKVAGLLEAVATRIRAMTVDRVARVIKFVTLGLVALTLVGLAFIFFLVGLFRIADELLRKACDCGYSMELAYAIVGGLFLVFGALLWRKRISRGAE